MRFKRKSRAVTVARELVLMPLGAVAGLHFAMRAWSSRKSLLPPAPLPER